VTLDVDASIFPDDYRLILFEVKLYLGVFQFSVAGGTIPLEQKGGRSLSSLVFAAFYTNFARQHQEVRPDNNQTNYNNHYNTTGSLKEHNAQELKTTTTTRTRKQAPSFEIHLYECHETTPIALFCFDHN
jgi:hypothetical protein